MCHFIKKRAQIFWFYGAEVICEREKPTDVPVPSAAFDHKGDALFVPFLAEDLEGSFFPDPLRCNGIDLANVNVVGVHCRSLSFDGDPRSPVPFHKEACANLLVLRRGGDLRKRETNRRTSSICRLRSQR